MLSSRAQPSRREFLLGCAAAIPHIPLPGKVPEGGRNVLSSDCKLAAGSTNASKGSALLGNRFLTFATVVRVNQIESRRGEGIGQDETAFHTPESVATFRNAFALGWPGGRITWALSWLALTNNSKQYKGVRSLISEYHERYGDEITFIPGGYFANAYNTREQVNRDLHDGLALAAALVGADYRPKGVIAGFLAAENLRFLSENEGIHVCQGNVWSQYAVDNQDADGSICYPYYPSTEHFCKPAQGQKDFIDCVNLDGWTCDFLAARRAGGSGGFNSRMGVGPIETIHGRWKQQGLKEMLHTTSVHFDKGFDLNGFAWVTNIWEIVIGPQGLTDWLSAVRRRWPDAYCITHGEFGLLWRQQFRDNSRLNYRFVERGSGIGGSDADKEIRWFMNQEFRLALLREIANNSSELVIDYTRYDLPAEEPRSLTRQWSLMGQINQKQTRPQDTPLPLTELSASGRRQILRKYPELSRLDGSGA